jgi:hypothetical protein
MERFKAKTVGNTIRVLWREKLIEGDGSSGYLLSSLGITAAIAVASESAAN